MLSFYAFPQEIQRMILTELANSTSRAAYVCVDKHWQAFFEARSFRHLTISQTDIRDLDSGIQGARRGYLKHLWLRVLLPERPYIWLKESEDDVTLWRADRIFTKSIFNLWDVLSEWGVSENPGFTFELSVHSPSDRGKHVRDNFFEKDVELYQEYMETGSTAAYKSSGDVYAQYLKPYVGLGGKFGLHTWKQTVVELFGWKPLEFNFNEGEGDLTQLREEQMPKFPTVSVIDRFLVRRQQFREISPTAVGKAMTSLPRLREVGFERWRCVEAQDEADWCRDAKSAFVLDLPASVKTLSLYGDTVSIFQEWLPKQVNTICLAKHLRNYGRHLENMSVSFVIDAEDFYQPFRSPNSTYTGTWPNLETLSLTSRVLDSSSRSRIKRLLCAAAHSVANMPRLRLLELWYGSKGRACVFRYRVVDTITEITWLSSYVTKIDQEVVDVWTNLSKAQGRSDVRVSIHELDPDNILSAGTVLRYLELREQILHPVSGYRIAWEEKKPR